MRAILALAFIGAVVAQTTVTDVSQSYRVVYSGGGCTASNAVYIYQNYAYDTTCVDSTCSDYTTYSEKTICASGAPKNLGVRRWDIWGTCSTSTTLPLVDYYLYTQLSVSIDRAVNDIETWKVGCQVDQSSGSTTAYYNLITAPATGGATVNDGGWCGTDGLCTSCSSSDDYTLATGTAGCDATTTDGYIETTQTFPTITTEADLFEIDYDTYVFPSKYPYTCCKIDGDCNCCVADGDSCCNPPDLFPTNICCDDNSALANNTLGMMVYQACLCDQNGAERGTYDSATNTCTPTDTTTSMTGNITTITSDLGEKACDYIKVFAWCNAHALQDEQYYEDVGNTDAWDTNEEFVGETVYYYIGNQGGASDTATGGDPCFTFGGYFQASGSTGGAFDMQVASYCELAVTGLGLLGYECDAECSSSSTLAFAALLALF